MKIALLGYGKMGKEVERVAIERGHTVVCKIDKDTDWENQVEAWKQAEVAIEFSVPMVVKNHLDQCFAAHKPVVVGTTGWKDFEAEFIARCNTEKQSVVAASNFSIGVHLFFKLIQQAAYLLHEQGQYNGSIEEIHHIHKLDAPSGTSLSMNAIWEQAGMLTLPIVSKREGEVVGIHEITFESDQDLIQIRHQAKSRAGFSLGAVVAAEWLVGKYGWFGMEEVLSLAQE